MYCCNSCGIGLLNLFGRVVVYVCVRSCVLCVLEWGGGRVVFVSIFFGGFVG